MNFFIFSVFLNIQNLFIENNGQYPSDILYSSFPTTMFIFKNKIMIKDIEITFKNINPNVKVKASDINIAVFNYFKGNDLSKWRTNVPSYSKIVYENIYKNVDLILTGLRGNKLEFQFIIKPKADVNDIVYEIHCSKCSLINKKKEILINQEGRDILSISNLRAYQGADEVEISFRNNGYLVSYEIGEYNHNEVLIIDPDLNSLIASTYLGGSNSEEGRSIYLDNSGNVFVSGHTMSSDFPTTVKAYDNTFNGNWDVFISKLDNSLSQLLASTFLGGGSNDYARSIYLDNSGNVYITGSTNSSNFPTTPNAYDSSFNGVYDGFISKLNNSLDSLLASTFLGGSSIDLPNSIKIEQNGNVYITGGTSSNNFPTTQNAYDNTFNGNSDAFVSKLDSSLSQLLASTFLGGSYNEVALSLQIGMSGNIYVSGSTYSSDFPTTPNAYDNSCGTDGNCNYDGINRYSDIFVSKLDSSLNQLIASTYLGGSSEDRGNSMDIDYNDSVYVAGLTYSSDFPTTQNAYDNSYNGNSDGFISKLNSSLSQLTSSTYIGGDTFDYVRSLYIAQDSSVYLIGETFSSNFPTTPNAYDNSLNGSRDVFISKLNGVAFSFENSISNLFKISKNSIIFSINKPSYIGINVYDLDGKLIKRISYGFVNSGIYEVKLNDLGIGIYILKVRFGEEVKQVKFIKGG